MKKDKAMHAQKILMIDDDQDFLLQQSIQFKNAGFDITVADNELLAKELFIKIKPDLVVVDLMMNDMDSGIVLSHFFKKTSPTTPVIMVTGVTREVGIIMERSSPAERSWIKADKVINKPIRFEQLKREVEMFLGTK